MISHRNPTIVHFDGRELERACSTCRRCLVQFHECGQTLDREGFRWRTIGFEFRAGIRPSERVNLVNGNTVGKSVFPSLTFFFFPARIVVFFDERFDRQYRCEPPRKSSFRGF